MIAQLTGVVVSAHGAHIVLDVHGVGYRIAVRSLGDFIEGSTVSIHTHLAVRENALDLYGFLLEQELRLFEELIKLPKIGPKSAMQILMQADVTTITNAVETQDAGYLTKVSGIGKKTAEKIVSELRDVLGGGATNKGGGSNQGDSDLIDALVTLGYTQKDARDALQRLPADITDTNERLKRALKNIGS